MASVQQSGPGDEAISFVSPPSAGTRGVKSSYLIPDPPENKGRGPGFGGSPGEIASSGPPHKPAPFLAMTRTSYPPLRTYLTPSHQNPIPIPESRQASFRILRSPFLRSAAFFTFRSPFYYIAENVYLRYIFLTGPGAFRGPLRCTYVSPPPAFLPAAPGSAPARTGEKPTGDRAPRCLPRPADRP